MSREYAEGLRDHKQAIFNAFKELIPILDRKFPDHTIIVRPHPTENQQVYKDIARNCQRVRVTNEGNVVPWLMATDVVIHNGCTTGVEAYMMGVPAISYRAQIDETYDMGFYRLPNLISHQCFDVDQLQETLTKIIRRTNLVPPMGMNAGRLSTNTWRPKTARWRVSGLLRSW